MRRRISDPGMRALVRAALDANWTLDDQRKHILLVSPQGQRVFMPWTPSDRRAVKNCAATLRRAGLDVPR